MQICFNLFFFFEVLPGLDLSVTWIGNVATDVKEKMKWVTHFLFFFCSFFFFGQPKGHMRFVFLLCKPRLASVAVVVCSLFFL